MSAADRPLADRPTFGRITVVGGGCYGGYYVRQVRRAVAAGALRCAGVTVVDRNPACPVARENGGGDSLVRVEIADWRAYFARYLTSARGAPDAANDAIVPSPLMPHLLRDWLVDAARARWPDRDVRVAPLAAAPPVPWERAAPDGTRYVSFATWMCPINCIEPAVCPHTRGPRDWSLAPTIRAYAGGLPGASAALAPLLFSCTHRAYGVGMIDVRDVLAADATIAALGAAGAAVDVLVGTVSHCHGALSRVVVAAAGAPTPA